MTFSLKRLMAATVLVASTTSAHALIIDNNDYTTDTISGLDWLDLSFTNNEARQTVGARLQVGGDLHGWRYASFQEMRGLVARFDNYTGYYPPSGHDPSVMESSYVYTDSRSYHIDDPINNNWSELFDLLGSTVQKSVNQQNAYPHEYMFGIYNRTNVPEHHMSNPSSYVNIGMAGFHNCAISRSNACNLYSSTDYNAIGFSYQNTNHDFYDLTLNHDTHLFNHQYRVDYLISQSNVNNPNSHNDYDLNFASFLVRNNPMPCSDNNNATIDTAIGPRCQYDPVPVHEVSEPSALALLGLGLASLGWTRRKKAK